jgi:hypothetical protein
MGLIPKAGENSPHTAIVRINWEVFPISSDGSYGLNQPVDIGLLLFKADGLSFEEAKNKLEAFLSNAISDKNFAHIWKRGQSI